LQYLSNLRDEYILKYLKKLDIKLVIGETDPFLSSNWQLRDLLGDKGISNQLYIWDNDAHRPRYWRKMVQLYL
jgi:esterase/lipase superfamily enzyme